MTYGFTSLQTLIVTTGQETAAPMGVIQGGWEYIGAAYLIAWGMLALYTVSLIVRTPSQK